MAIIFLKDLKRFPWGCLIPLVFLAGLAIAAEGQEKQDQQRSYVAADSMRCDGRTDDTAAFNTIVTAAVSGAGTTSAPLFLKTVNLPAGTCRFASAPKPIPAGIKILGNHNRNGTWLIADYNEPDPDKGFLTWDASYPAPGSGIGGGLEHVRISKGSAKTGGTAIKLVGRDDLHRPSFMLFNDLYINSAFGSPGYWHRHLLIDGGCCMTPGGTGIRDIMLTNFHFGQSRPPHEGESILILNGVGIHISNGIVFASENGGIRITGNREPSHYVLIANMNVLGTVLIDNAEGVSYSGRIGGKLVSAAGVKNCFIEGIMEGTISNGGDCSIVTTREVSVSGPIGTRDPDSAGTLVLQNGKVAHQFARTFGTAPVCTATDNDDLSPVRVTVDVHQLTVFGVGNHKVSFICIARD